MSTASGTVNRPLDAVAPTGRRSADPARGPRGTRKSRRGAGPLVYAVALVVVALTLGPVLYAVLGGFRTNAQLADSPAGLPSPWVLDNYRSVLASSSFWTYALNSAVIATMTTTIVVILGLMAAYPLARYRFRWREPLYMVFVVGLLFPATVAIIPLFILVTRDLHMGNTWWGVALPQAAFALPMTVVILRPFLMALPDELEEAAQIDGATRIQFFWKVVVPLSGPGMVTVGVLAFVGSWNAYLLPLLLLQGDKKTLPLGVADFSSQYSSDTAGVFAFTTLAMIPALVFFLAAQRRIVSGLQGAVKG
ncbi:carbohydrate ABC transporter permease [Intrasporangium mesophilum]